MDNLIVQYFTLGLNNDEILLFLEIKHNISISIRTLKRRFKHLNIYRRKHYTPIEHLFAFLNEELAKSGKMHGYKWMHLKCLQAGLVVQQESVRLALKILDYEGVYLRKRNRLQRRQYHNKGPNFLWHVDSYDKLKPYGICINGCIDGFSRHIMWLQASYTNNDPSVIAGYFMEVVSHLKGCPKMLRADMGTENRYMEQIQNFFAQQNNFEDIIFMYGKSTANQRIEAWWSILRKHSAQFWMNLFQTIKDNGYYDGTFLDRSLIQYVFMDLIQTELDTICLEWNAHRISGSKNSVAPRGRPIVMFELPELYETRDYIISLQHEDISNCQEECVYINHPCDKDIFDLCQIILEERNQVIPKDPYEAVDIYLLLREEIIHML